jgi:tRNA threonylcarbamoyladenosine biosynthesis protein TsaE
MEITAKSLKETEKLASDFVKKLTKEAPKKEATVVALEGNLGAGKTAFVKGIAEAFGIKKELVQSPTFVIQKVYTLENKKFHQLFHIDAYRFDDATEANILNLEILLKNPHNLIVIEWPDRISSLIPKNAHWIRFMFVNESTRKIKLNV